MAVDGVGARDTSSNANDQSTESTPTPLVAAAAAVAVAAPSRDDPALLRVKDKLATFSSARDQDVVVGAREDVPHNNKVIDIMIIFEICIDR